MTQAKHTPAPWKFKKLQPENRQDGFYVGDCIVEADGDCIYSGKFQSVSDEERDANAHLIAAAPELLEALQELLEHTSVDYDYHGNNIDKEQDVAIIKADKAIAKARGETCE